MDSEEWYPDGQDRVTRRRITVVRAFSRITPCRALHFSVEVIQVFDLLDRLKINLRVLGDLIEVLIK